jgi:hypothetical protein
MPTRLHCIIIVSLLTLLGACASTFEATYDYDRKHNFSNYQTFAWISKNPMIVAETNRVVNPLLEGHIMSAHVMMPENADFVVSFTVGSREKIRVDSHPTYGGYYAGGGPGRWGWGSGYYGGYYGTETTVRQYTKGMLAVDIFDVKERRPVWHAVATKTISESDREKIAETVNMAVNSVLGGFPPPPGG